MTRTLAMLLGLAALPAQAVECQSVAHADTSFTVCEVDLEQDDLRLFLNDAEGQPIGQFSALERDLAEQQLTLRFAMNAGMYHEDRAPVGHYVQDGVELMRVIATPGPGNFGLLPNGVFCIQEDRADVVETLAFVDQASACAFATQSGPMLVIDGALHPRFLEDGTSTYIRNGVGTSADGRTAFFAISDRPVNFYTFGTLFRDTLAVPNALFLDGNISRLYAPDIGRNDFGFRMGPIVAVVAPAEQEPAE
ncbi:MAG: phosphodiester glycosidase family protein [Roseobacter sp.]